MRASGESILAVQAYGAGKVVTPGVLMIGDARFVMRMGVVNLIVFGKL